MMISLMFCFIMLQIFDAMTTTYILKNGGEELNPFMRRAYGLLGIGGAMVVIKGVLLIIVTVLWNEQLTFWLCVLYAMVFGHNVYQMSKD